MRTPAIDGCPVRQAIFLFVRLIFPPKSDFRNGDVARSFEGCKINVNCAHAPIYSKQDGERM
jgi:hypothetical protein